MSNVTRDEIKPQVISILSIVSGYPASSIEEEKELEWDLDLNSDKRGSLAPDFTGIIEKYNKENYISKSECKGLKKVKDCIDKVHEKAE